MLILPSLLKIQFDEFNRFFVGHLFPSSRSVIMGIVISHSLNGVFG